MGVLAWAREVIRDTGEVAPIRVRVEDGPGGCFLVAGVDGGETRIAVDRRPNPAPHPILKEIHSCQVAGRALQAESADALAGKVARMLEAMAPGRTLPLAYFRAPAAGYELPVYADGEEVVAHAFGGPRSRAGELAELRAHVVRHLVSASYVATPDDLEVALVDQDDLSVIEPGAVIRSLHDPELWIPWTDRGAAEPRIDRLGLDASATGHDVLGLLAWARTTLDRPDADFLFAAQVSRAAWAAAESASTDSGLRLHAELDGDPGTALELPVLRTRGGGVAAALALSGVEAFLAPTEGALAAGVGLRLQSGGFIPSPERVAVTRAG